MSKLVTIKIVKIAIFDPYLDSLGGGEKYMLTAAACLAEKHRVSILWDDKSILNQVHERFNIDITKIDIQQNIFNPKISLFRRLLKSKAYDAIFYLSDGSIPLVATKLFLHIQFPLEWIHGNSLSNKVKMQRVTAVICNSEFTKSYIDKTFGIKSYVVYPPSSGEYPLLETKKTNTILSVGRYHQLTDGTTFKKQETMIRMFKALIDQGVKDWKLILVISYRPEDKEKVTQLQNTIGKYPIEIVTNVPNQKLITLYSKAKIYWHAAGYGEDIITHPELAEHFGIATVQAMEQGAVPVVFSAGGQKEIITTEKNGYLWTTEEMCLSQTRLLIEKPSVWEKISIQSKKRAIDFTREAFCKKLYKIIS